MRRTRRFLVPACQTVEGGQKAQVVGAEMHLGSAVRVLLFAFGFRVHAELFVGGDQRDGNGCLFVVEQALCTA